MDDSETYMNTKPTKTGSRAPSRDHLNSSYTRLNIRKVESLNNTQTDDLDHTYTQLNFRQNELHIVQEEDLPLSSGPGEMPVTAQAAVSEVKIGNRTYRLIFLLCLVTSAVILIVVGHSIYGMHSDLRHRFTEMETKYRSVNATKAQLCDVLTSSREQTCSKGWVPKKDRCYYVSSIQTSFPEAMQRCANRYSRLLEIKSSDEASFVSHTLVQRGRVHWIGKCENGNSGWSLLYHVSSGKPACRQCKSNGTSLQCERDRRFICESPAPVFPNIPEKIQGLCQQPVEATSVAFFLKQNAAPMPCTTATLSPVSCAPCPEL